MNNESGWNAPEESIRITKKDAMSTHVDDLLRRQKNLRGDAKSNLNKKGVWYLQNWFIFGIVGAAAAFLATLLIEPHFDDYLYIQGEIDSMDLSEDMPRLFDLDGQQYYELQVGGKGWIEIRGERIWLLSCFREFRDGEVYPFDPLTLEIGQEVGVYTEYVGETGYQPTGIGQYIDLSPSDSPPKKAFLSQKSLSKQNDLFGMLLFPLIACIIGLAIGASDGFVCRLPRRAFLGGFVGMLVGFVGGFIATIPSGLIYQMINAIAVQDAYEATGIVLSPGDFFLQMCGRGIAWCIAGMAMGLGQGIAMRSKRLLLYGFLGGLIGGLIGGLLFDPIDILILGIDKPSSHWSRFVGFTTIGLCVGLMIGLVEFMARDAWLRMTEGPLAGKEFLFFKDTMIVGSSPKSDIYLFNDDKVLPHHATLRAMGEQCELESTDSNRPVLLNERPILKSTRIRNGDRITLGRTSFVFYKKRG